MREEWASPAAAPDSPFAAELIASPNHGPRRTGTAPSLVILHYTGMIDAAAALARLTDPLAEVSCHYLVLECGRILQLVPEAARAWHAGIASWGGEADINSASIGIEIVNRGHDGGCPAYPGVQIDAVAALCSDISRRWTMPRQAVLGHSDVSPGRKRDPGEAFPWPLLHRAGVGHWVEPAPIDAGPGLGMGDVGPAVQKLQAKLALYGYGVETTCCFDARTASVVEAFQRHFRPARVDGIADASTLATLDALLRALGKDPA